MPLIVMYAPLGIGRRSGQTFRSLVCVPRNGAYIQAKSAWTYAPPANALLSRLAISFTLSRFQADKAMEGLLAVPSDQVVEAKSL